MKRYGTEREAERARNAKATESLNMSSSSTSSNMYNPCDMDVASSSDSDGASAKSSRKSPKSTSKFIICFGKDVKVLLDDVRAASDNLSNSEVDSDWETEDDADVSAHDTYGVRQSAARRGRENAKSSSDDDSSGSAQIHNDLSSDLVAEIDDDVDSDVYGSEDIDDELSDDDGDSDSSSQGLGGFTDFETRALEAFFSSSMTIEDLNQVNLYNYFSSLGQHSFDCFLLSYL